MPPAFLIRQAVRKRAGVVVLSFVVALPPESMAQAVRAVPPSLQAGSDSVAFDVGMEEFGVWASGSFESPTVFAGEVEKRTTVAVGLRYGRVLWNHERYAISYVVDVIPVVMLLQPRVKSLSGDTYAAGVSPLGIKFSFRPAHRVVPFASWTGGFVYGARRLPTRADTRFKFTSHVGLGIQLVQGGHAWSLGYQYQHLSNGGLVDENPGIDSHMLLIGVSFLR